MLLYARDGRGVYEDDGVYTVRLYPKRDGRWNVAGWYRGHRSTTCASATYRRQADAEAGAACLWRDYLQGVFSAPNPPPLTLGELVDRFLARTETRRGRKLAASTERAYRTQLASLLEVAGPDRPLCHVTQAHVRRAVDVPPAQRSKAQYYASIRALVRWAMRQGWLGVDITAGIHVDPGPDRMKPFLQPGEVGPFLAACSPSMRIRAGLILYTGLRVGEACHMRWGWVSTGLGMPSIHVPATDPETGWTTKSHRARGVPLLDEALGFVEEAKKKWGAEGFVLHGRSKPPRPENWSRDVRAACKRAAERTKRPSFTVLGVHGLRRTAGALWIHGGMGIYEVSRLLGHSSVTVTERAYAGLVDGHLAKQMAAVGEALRTPVVRLQDKRKDGDG